MKKFFLALGVSFVSLAGFAQTGNNQIGVGAELALPTGDMGDVYKAGIGVTVKGLYGIGEAGQITLTTGLISFGAKSDMADWLGADKIKSNIIPILAGYRHNFQGFYGEPQVGYSIASIKVKGGEFDGSDSDGAFTWGLNAGYVFNNKIDAGIRYQSSHKDGSSTAFFGIKVAYLFSLAGK